MKLWKKIAIVLMVVILLAQIPFIYNRYRFGRLAGQIEALGSQRAQKEDPNFDVYRGVIHAHTFLGGHSSGSFEELIGAARSNRLDFVVMTEHTSDTFDTSAQTLRGNHHGTLFVSGQEVSTAVDRFLQIPGDAETPQAAKMTTPDYLRKVRAANKLAFVTHPEKFKTWDADFDGVEVFSLHTNAKKINPFFAFFDVLWSHYSYPRLVFAKYSYRPAEFLRQYDELARTRRLTLFAGTDTHSNIGVHLFGDDSGNKLVGVKLDDYDTVLSLVRNHVLLEKGEPLTEESLLRALKNGRCYVAFDVFGDAKGFSFAAENGAEAKTMGDEIALREGVNLKAASPLPARFVLFRNGEQVFEAKDTALIEFQAKEPGAYRAEVYLDALGAPYSQMPWIISNPIYVK